jgi:DNA helicase-2/ATP-dependent DNA helicase PcrA
MDAKGLKLALAYKSYEKLLVENGVLDFDGLIFWMTEILDRKPDVRKRWVRDWIQIDEAQDCSKIEWNLAQLISGKSVLAVGDLSQGLFSFRGSDSKLFGSMGELFPGTRTLYLGRNYRSTPEIVEFIKPHAISQDLASKFHTTNDHGPVPKIYGFTSAASEATWVVTKIKESNV